MNYNIEWLFEEVYALKEEANEKLHFISDWDVHGAETSAFKEFLYSIYHFASDHSRKYNYAYEQFALKQQVIDLARTENSLSIVKTEITITPSSTISIFLASNGLFALGAKRILVITPAYFSTHESLNKAGCTVFYYHLEDETEFTIDFERISTLVKDQYLDGIILTDPVYSSGIELSLDYYSRFTEICTQNNIYFIVDYSLGGLQWNGCEHFVLNTEKLKIVKECPKHLFIDTLSKRLLLNGIKFSVLIGDERIIDKIDLISETVYGGLSSVQCQLIKELYKPANTEMISQLCKENIGVSQHNYNLIQSMLLGTDFHLADTNSGYFSLIRHNTLTLAEIDTKKTSLFLLKEKKVICLTSDRFTYFRNNKFGFRINLNRYNHELMFPLRQCIGVDYSRFYKGQ